MTETSRRQRLIAWWKRHHAHHRTWPQRLVLAFNLGLILGLLLVAGGLGYAWSKYSRLPRVAVSGALSESAGSDEPQNFLIVGVDTTLDADDPRADDRPGVTGQRSDTIMVLRTEPGAERAELLSLPRDLWVPMASGGRQRINTAVQIGGPEELIDTIESYLEIPIHHFVQLDFGGFLGLVQAIDGVPIYFPYEARDRESGLYVAEPGCVTLDPEQALAYARSRTYQYRQDGRWRTDGSGDLGRISRQQDFIRRALSRAIDKGVRNPVKLDRLIDVGLRSVRVDDLITADDLLGLARRLRSLDPVDLEMLSLPVVEDTVGGAAILRLVEDDAQATLARFRGAEPQAPTEAVRPDEVRLLVLNGSGRSGEASEAAAELAAAGFRRAGTPSNDDQLDQTRTLVRYRPGSEAQADLVARWLVAGAELVEAGSDLPAEVVVVTGLDWDGVAETPQPSATPPPTSTLPPDEPDTPEADGATTTTVRGEVPQQPAGVDC